MNRIHRLVFNHTLGLVQVASERVRRHSRRAGGASVPCLSPLAAGLALALASAGPVAAQELIDGTHEIVDGYDPGGSGSGTRPSPWVIDGELGIAHGGIAGLTIRNGGSVSADAVLLGIEATGSGSLTLSGSGSLRGILETGYLEKGAGSATITFNGGVLRAGSSQQDFLRNFGAGDVIIGSNGAFIDSNGHAIGIGSSLEGSGRLNKIGEGTLTLTGSGSITGGIRIEQGALAVAGGGTVSSTADIVAGYAADADGTVLVSGRDSVLESTGRLAAVRIGREGQGQLRIEDGGQVRSTYLMVVGDRETGSGTVSVTGAGSLLETISDAPSFIGNSGQGRLEIGAGGHVRSMYFASVGYRESGVGVAHVSGEGSVWSVRSEREPGGNMYVGDAGDGTLVLADGGHLDLGDTPASHVTLARETGSSGLLVLGAQPGQPAAAAGTINARSIHFGHGDATLVFNHAGEEYVLDLELRSEPSSAAGAGEDRIEHLAGFTRLTGRGTRFTGTTAVIGGTLAVDDRLGGTVQVLDGGTLAGSGTVGTTTVHDGGTLAPGGSIGTLTVNGDLTLSSGARLGFGLGSPGPADDPAAGRSDTVNVAGDLVLDGTLDLFAAGDPEGSPGLGYYRLFTYGGALQDNGLEIGQAPGVDDPARYLLQAGGQRVDLFIAALGEDTLQHWQGGDGTWSADSLQWLNQGGQVPVAWAGNHAVFRHQPGDFTGGTVTVEGTQSFHGLQFVDNGYVLEGDGQLRTDAGGAEVRVLTGASARIATSIAGDGGLNVTGGGTLVLTGSNANSYAGTTTVRGTTLELARDYGVTSVPGDLFIDGGTVNANRQRQLARDSVVTLANGGRFTANQWQNFAGLNAAEGGGTVTLNYDLDLTGSGTYDFSGTLDGSGGILQITNGTHIFRGDNGSWFGDVELQGGTLGLGHDLAMGTAEISVWRPSSIRLFADDLTLGNDIRYQPAGSLVIDSNGHDGTWAGRLHGGAGDTLAKTGTGTLTYSGDGSGMAGNVRVSEGTLAVEGVLGGTLEVLEGATLSGSGTVGSTTVHDGGLLAPGSSIGTLTVDGDLTLLSGASLAFELGSPGPADDPAAGRSDTVNVAGDLVLDGTLDLFAAGDPEGSPGLGYYRLFTYGGALQDNGLEIGQAPGVDDPARYLLQMGGQRVDLFIAALGEDTLQHWQGGDGTWSADSQQWLNQGGQVPVAWAGNHAVFRHQPGDFTGGTVTVEGTQSFHGLQFVDNGYVLEGDGQLRTDAGGAEVRVLEGVSAHISVAVAGDGGLAKTGGGTLVLSGHNLYAGGTTLAGGTLSVSADTSLGAASGGLAFDGGTLHASTSFDSSRAVTLTSHGTIETADGTTLTLAGSVSGAGSLTKTGGGTLALSGANDHAGGTTVAGGTLTGSAGSFGSGAIKVAGGAGLELEQSADGRLGNALSGTGRITKDGAGALIYSGDGARFAGTTRVRAGTLAVDGILGGTLDVLEGATLTGGGRIGRLALYGNLDLGGPGGRMDVQDDALLHAGSRWNLYAGASGQADRLSVAGRVSIDPGSTLAILAGGPGSWAPRTAYTIVTAGNGVEGGFGSVTSNLAFLAPTLVYGQDRITLALERNDVRFADRVLTRNQRAAAEGAEPLGFGHAVYEAVVTLVDDDARLAEAFDALSGEAHASSRALLLEDARAMDAAIARRLDGEVSMGQLRPDGTLLWVDGSGGQIRLGGDGNAARATASAEGLALGADVAAGERTRIGAAVGTRRVLQRVNGRASRIDGDGRQLALYAGTQLGHLTLRGGVARTDYDLDLERRVGIGTLDQRLEARHEATATTWFAEAALDWNESTLPRPWLALAHTRLSSDAAAETGGSAALDVARGRHEVGTATLGLRGAWDVSGGRSVATLQADLGWRHAWGDLTPGAAAAFADGDSFTVHAPAMSRNAAVYRLGLGLAPTPRSRVAIGLQGQAGDRVRTFGGHLQWQVSF